MHWLVYDTIENPYFLRGVLDVEDGIPLQEVCTIIPNQVSYEQGRFFNCHLKSLGKSYKDYLYSSGKIKSDRTEEMLSVIDSILPELDLAGLI